MLSKKERIDQKKLLIGSKRERKRGKHSDRFNIMFKFFFQIVRKDFINFCGSRIDNYYDIQFDTNSIDAKVAFKKYENGEYAPDEVIRTQHPQILYMLIVGKKSWGLWKDEYSLGIAEGTFTKYEILEEFTKNGIVIPESYLIEFTNKIWESRSKLENGNKDLDELNKNFKLRLFNNKLHKQL